MTIFRNMPLMAKKSRADREADTEQVNLRISSRLLDQLDAIGEPSGLKRSHLIQQALFEFVQRNRGQLPPDGTTPATTRTASSHKR